MGYDIHLQILYPGELERLFEHLVAGRSPPPSAFDQRGDASALWDEARDKILSGEPGLAARTACQLAAIWSAESHPHVWLRNLGVTYHPLRMEDELRGLPSAGFGASMGFLHPLLALRPELEEHVPHSLDGSYSTGGFCSSPGDVVPELRAFHRSLDAPLQRRVFPLLMLLREAQRRGACVLESSDLLDVGEPPEAQPWWQELLRTTPGGPALSAGGWAELERHWLDRDVDDVRALDQLGGILERIVEADLDEPGVLAPICGLLHRICESYLVFPDEEILGVLCHLEGPLEARTYPRAWIPYERLTGKLTSHTPQPRLRSELVDAALDALRRGPDDTGLIRALIRHYTASTDRFLDPDPPVPELARGLLEALQRHRERLDLEEPDHVRRHLIKDAGEEAAQVLLAQPHGPELLEILCVDLLDAGGDVAAAQHQPLVALVERCLEPEGIPERLARQIARALTVVITSYEEDPLPDPLLSSLARAWHRLSRVAPDHAALDCEGGVQDPRLPEAVLALLLADEPEPSGALLSTVLSVLYLTPPERPSDGSLWQGELLDRHQDAMLPLLAHGLASSGAPGQQSDPLGLRRSIRQTALYCLPSGAALPWLAPVLLERVRAGDARSARQLIEVIPSTEQTRSIVIEALLLLLAEGMVPSSLGALIEQGVLEPLAGALEAGLETSERDASVRSILLLFEELLEERPEQALEVLERLPAELPEPASSQRMLARARALEALDQAPYASLVGAGHAQALVRGFVAHLGVVEGYTPRKAAAELAVRLIPIFLEHDVDIAPLVEAAATIEGVDLARHLRALEESLPALAALREAPGSNAPEQLSVAHQLQVRIAALIVDRSPSTALYLLDFLEPVAPTSLEAHLVLLRAKARESRREPAYAALIEGGRAKLLLEGLRRHIDLEQPAGLASLAQDLSSRCIVHGAPDVAVSVVDAVLQHVPEDRRPDLLYNQACAHSVRGRAQPAIDALARAIALDPRQADDARDDVDFAPIQDHPAFRELVRR